jgi:branched-chain amino acid transport system permease protein
VAGYRGINIHALFALAWGIATAIAMFTGALYSLNQQVNPALSEVAIRGLAVALVGGMDSIKGVVPAALLIAALEVLTQRYVSPQASDAVPFVLLILVLLVRPWGFLGTKEAIDRI